MSEVPCSTHRWKWLGQGQRRWLKGGEGNGGVRLLGDEGQASSL